MCSLAVQQPMEGDMPLIRLTDMGGRAVYVKAEAIVRVRRDECFDHKPSSGSTCTIVFVDGQEDPIEVRTKPGRIARLVRQATSWFELP